MAPTHARMPHASASCCIPKEPASEAGLTIKRRPLAGVMVDYEQGGEPDASATKATVILVTKYPAPNRCTSPAAKPRAAAAAAWEIRRGDQ